MTCRHRQFCIAFLLAVARITIAQPLKPPADAKAKVDEIFARFNRGDSPGCAVGVDISGNSALRGAYGMADLEHSVALTPETVFEPGSIAKQFTAAAVLLLAQQGKLSLDDPIQKYIPEVPNYGTPITIRRLLNHTSGLRDWGNVAAIGGWPRTTRVYTMAHVLEIVSRQHALNYPPGAAYSYTNTGYNLAAILVSGVAQTSFPEFTQQAIFKPLKMTSTQWRDDFRRIVSGRAIAYDPSGSTYRQDMPFENIYGNGGLLTTVGDLLRWNRNFVDGIVGGRALLDAQLEQGQLTNGRTIFYAVGLMIPRTAGLREISHSGSTAGYNAWLGQYPKKDLSVAVLCNVSSANATQLAHRVADVYLGPGVRVPRPGNSPPVEVSALDSRAGLYRDERDHQTVTIGLKQGQLQFNGRDMLTPAGKDAFSFGEDGSVRIVFYAEGAGNESRMRVSRPADEDVVYDKVETASPNRTDLESMSGEYRSDEAEVTFIVALEHDGLVIHRRPDAAIPLKPTYRDGFSSSLGSIRFLQDSSGRVTELSLGDPRVWDLRFRRVR